MLHQGIESDAVEWQAYRYTYFTLMLSLIDCRKIQDLFSFFFTFSFHLFIQLFPYIFSYHIMAFCIYVVVLDVLDKPRIPYSDSDIGGAEVNYLLLS